MHLLDGRVAWGRVYMPCGGGEQYQSQEISASRNLKPERGITCSGRAHRNYSLCEPDGGVVSVGKFQTIRGTCKVINYIPCI
jgi:hypothetical protein